MEVHKNAKGKLFLQDFKHYSCKNLASDNGDMHKCYIFSVLGTFSYIYIYIYIYIIYIYTYIYIYILIIYLKFAVMHIQ